MSITEISVIGGLLITAIGIISNAIITIVNKNIEYRQTRYKTIMDCAYKEWEEKNKIAMSIADKSGKDVKIVPFGEYIIYYSEFMRLINKKKATEKDFDSFHKRVREKTDLYYNEKRYINEIF